MHGETVLLDGVAVDNVLVEPGLSRDAEDIQLPAGTVVDYTLRFPIAHRGPVHDAKVTVRGRELDTLVFADHLNPTAVFGTWHGDWDMTVIVGRSGDYTALLEVVELVSTTDEMGDPVTVERTVFSGMGQARNASGSGPSGSAVEQRDVETWWFVVPWQTGFASLRPSSTLIRYGGSDYDVIRVVNVDQKSEVASFEAVRDAQH